MRLVMQTGKWMDPTDGAIVPEILKRGSEVAGDAVQESIGHFVTTAIQHGALWLKSNGIPIATEGLLIWGLVCYLVACSGSGKWLERGTRALLMSVLLGVARIVGQV